jgi:hypothetical protein
MMKLRGSLVVWKSVGVRTILDPPGSSWHHSVHTLSALHPIDTSQVFTFITVSYLTDIASSPLGLFFKKDRF